MAYTTFWTKAPPGRKKIFQKEQPVMVMKPSLSIYIELYIINPFPNNKYWRTFFSFFYLRKDILPDFSLLGFKRKMIWIWKRKNFLGRRKKYLLIRPWVLAVEYKVYFVKRVISLVDTGLKKNQGGPWRSHDCQVGPTWLHYIHSPV